MPQASVVQPGSVMCVGVSELESSFEKACVQHISHKDKKNHNLMLSQDLTSTEELDSNQKFNTDFKSFRAHSKNVSNF